jgi:hypothetical protein
MHAVNKAENALFLPVQKHPSADRAVDVSALHKVLQQGPWNRMHTKMLHSYFEPRHHCYNIQYSALREYTTQSREKIPPHTHAHTGTPYKRIVETHVYIYISTGHLLTLQRFGKACRFALKDLCVYLCGVPPGVSLTNTHAIRITHIDR